MKAYDNLDNFFEEQMENLITNISSLNKIFKDDITIIIEKDGIMPQHFYFISKKMENHNLDVNADLYFSNLDKAPASLKNGFIHTYSKIADTALPISTEDLTKLLEITTYLAEADNKIGWTDVPDNVIQYEISTKGLNIVFAPDIERKQKSSFKP